MSEFRFPTRQERRELIEKLRELEASSGQALTNNQLYIDYQQALKTLDARMEELSRTDELGLLPVLSAEMKEDLQAKMISVAEAGETFLANLEQQNRNLSQGVPGMVNRLQGLLSRDYEAIANYDPAASLSLPEIQENARTRTIDLNGREIATLGNNMSSRIPMTVTNSRGDRRPGVFTKASYNHLKSDFMKVLEDAKAVADDEGKAEIDKLIPNFRAHMKRRGETRRDGAAITENDSVDHTLGLMSRFLRDEFGREGQMGPDDFNMFLSMQQLNPSKISDEAKDILAQGISRLRESPGAEISNYNLEQEEGDRIDNRNSCMSSIAGLLGVSGLIARSESMQFTGPDGQTIPGTFMEYGKGLDLDREPELFEHVSDDPFANIGNLRKQMADLQVLDFICLNVDRHTGNLLYQVNEKGELTGIQGIDNDSAFARRDVLVRDVNNLRVVSESMAKKLEKLTPEMIRFALRGRGLSEKEIERSSERLTKVKDAIKNKQLRTVKDSEFATLDSKDLKGISPGKTIFERVEDFITKNVKLAREYGYDFVPLKKEPDPPELTQINATDRKGTVAGLEDTLKDVSDYVNDKKKGIVTARGKSGKFGKLLNAAKDAQKLYKDIRSSEDIDKRAMLTEISARPTLKKASEAFQKIADTADDYLKYKMKQRKVNTLEELKKAAKNTYELSHINYAEKMLGFADQYNEQLDGPKNEAEQKEAMLNNERRELDLRKQGFGREVPPGSKKPVDPKVVEAANKLQDAKKQQKAEQLQIHL